jgi:BASS family bile acid:Na+ symporter
MLQELTNWLVVLFALTGMAALGLSLKFEAIVRPLRDIQLVLMTLLLNFVVAPFLAVGLTRLFPLDPDYVIGLVLLGSAAGAPFLPKLVELAKGDLALSVGVMVLQMAATLVFLPLALPCLISGIEVNPWAVVRPLVLLMILPLAMGLVVQRVLPQFARHVHPWLALAANLSLLGATLLLLILNGSSFLATLGSGAAAVGLLFVFLNIIAGALAGRVRRGVSSVLALSTGQRNIAAALVVATSNQMKPDVVVMLLLTTFAGLPALLAVAVWFRRQPRHPVTERGT